MPRPVVRPRALRLAASLVFVAMTACSSAAPDHAQAPLAGAAIGGPFTLTAADGKTVR